MNTSSPKLWVLGWTGAILGASLTLLGLLTPGELSGLLGGYGLMTFGSALYLVAGLKLRETLARRRGMTRATVNSSHGPISTTASRP
jgi:hypothetical protein